MTKRYALFFLLSLFCLVAASASGKCFTLVIDAGHGGKDAGARGKYSNEKTINLNVALAFGRYVEQNCPDVRVIYTRKTDVFIPLHQRAAIANSNKADVFISIHTNAVASKRPVTGLETYTMGMRRSGEKLSAAMRENEVVLIEKDYQQHYSGFDPRSPESYIMFDFINDANMLKSIELAKGIQKNVCRTAGRPDKGVKQDVFLVLRETSMPACLVEVGYITTASEEAYLNKRQNIDAIGRGIYQAFVEYKNKQTQAPPKVTSTKVEPVKQEPVKQEPAKQPEPAKPELVQQEAEKSEPVDTVVAPVVAEEPVKADSAETAAPAQPVFKVQFLSSGRLLKAGAREFKGLTDVDSYKDGTVWKYTVGASADYNAIRRLRRQVAATFPQAFIIAFKNGGRMDTQAAINEFNQNKR